MRCVPIDGRRGLARLPTVSVTAPGSARASCLALVASVLACGPALGEPVTLRASDLRAAVAGSTVELDTPLGIPLPITYKADGTLVGKAGRLTRYLGSSTDTGAWWLDGDRLCQRWKRWLQRQTQCVDIRRQGKKIYWREAGGRVGTGTIVAQVAPPQPAPQPPPFAANRQALGGPVDAPPLRPAPITQAEPLVRGREEAATQQAPPRAPSYAPTYGRPWSPPAQPAPRLAYRVIDVASNDVLNIRSHPSASAKKIGEIPPHGRGILILSGCQGQWCFVGYGHQTGWVHSAYLGLDTVPAVAGRR